MDAFSIFLEFFYCTFGGVWYNHIVTFLSNGQYKQEDLYITKITMRMGEGYE